MKNTNNPTNVPTAQLRIKILEIVMKEDYYPNDWFMVNDLEKEFMNDEITYEQYNQSIKKLLENYK